MVVVRFITIQVMGHAGLTVVEQTFSQTRAILLSTGLYSGVCFYGAYLDRNSSVHVYLATYPWRRANLATNATLTTGWV